MTQALRNAVNWFEIPTHDLDRAQRFYETVLGADLRREELGSESLAIFPYDEPGVGGALVADAAPGADRVLVYLDASPTLDAALARVAAAGGRVALPRTELPDGLGAYAHIIDSEGNRVGLHAMR